MNGKLIYFTIAALLGLLCALVKFLPFFFVTLLYLYLLAVWKRFGRSGLILVGGMAISFFMIGEHKQSAMETAIPETTTQFIIDYIQPPVIDGDLLQIHAVEKSFNEKLIIRYEIQSEEEKKQLQTKNFFGRVCIVSGTMNKPKIAKNPNSFDYRSYLKRKGIYWIVDITDRPLERCTSVKTSPIVWIEQLRQKGIRFLERNFSSEIAALSAALIFGDQNMLDPTVLSNYQKTGLVHLLAISGLHVSLCIGMVFYGGIRCGLTRQFMTNFLLVVLPIYAILTGASPSVNRSVLMISLILLTQKWNGYHKLLPLDAICLTGMLLLLCSPMLLFDVGFQLSFSVSLAIILSAPHILHKYRKKGMQVLATSISAQLAAMPLLLYHFFEVSFIGVVANLLYIPLFSFVFLPGLNGLFLIQLIFGRTPSVLLSILSKIILLSNRLIELTADLSFTRFIPGRPNLFMMMVYLLIVVVIFCLWEFEKGRKRTIYLCLSFGVLLTFQPLINWLKPNGEVTMIDVGQGDSILIHLPHGQGNYLIDTGGAVHFAEEKWREQLKPFEVGRDVVIPYLKGKGITTIDKLILTHGDMDHIGGALSIIQTLEVKQILLPSVVEPSDAELEVIEEANKRGIPIMKVSEGDQWTEGENEFLILSPTPNYRGERNGSSITFITNIGGLKWFFGGDLDQAGEERIIQKYPNLTIDVLKVGHHGSKTSSAAPFIEQIHPRIALISAGENNRFGHPHQEVLNRLEDTNAKIFRTDQQGAITYSFSPRTGTFSTFLP